MGRRKMWEERTLPTPGKFSVRRPRFAWFPDNEFNLAHVKPADIRDKQVTRSSATA